VGHVVDLDGCGITVPVKERVELCLFSLSWPSWSILGRNLHWPSPEMKRRLVFGDYSSFLNTRKRTVAKKFTVTHKYQYLSLNILVFTFIFPGTLKIYNRPCDIPSGIAKSLQRLEQELNNRKIVIRYHKGARCFSILQISTRVLRITQLPILWPPKTFCEKIKLSNREGWPLIGTLCSC
jgi:hypothetical protein